MKHKKPYSPTEIEHAKRLFVEAKARGTLKQPRAVAVVSLYDGGRHALNASLVTYRDYLIEARRALASSK